MRPMLASPTAAPPVGDAWRHEIKWDGIRALVTVAHGKVSIETRSGNDCSTRFPEVTDSHLRDFEDLVLDGEMIAIMDGLPNFRAVMHRLSPRGYSRGRNKSSVDETLSLASAPLQFVAFDVLRAAGHDVTALPWHARRELLEGVELEQGSITVPPVHRDGTALFSATASQQLEGVVSKHVDSPYRAGIRSDEWLKSVHRRTDSFVVGGWRPVAGSTGTVGALLVGEFRDGMFLFRGRVGTGISAASGAALLDVLVPAPECPFQGERGAALSPEDRVGTHWVKPSIVVDITYLGTDSGGRLRQPSYKGLRLDIGISRG